MAVITFGGELLLSSNSVWHPYLRARHRLETARWLFLAGEMTSGSAPLQYLAGLAAIVLGLLAVIGDANVLMLVGPLVSGATVLLTGSTLEQLHGAGCRPQRSTSVAIVGARRID